MLASIRAFFRVDERGSSYLKELLAGISTYLSLSYIFIVNPAILSKAGMDVSAVLFATAIASGVTTILMGLWANLPFAVAPGLEMNGFFALAAVGAWHLSPPQALGATFIAGVICVVLTLTPLFPRLISAIPPGLKSNIGVSVGIFVATTGLYLAKIITFGANGAPDFSSWSAQVLTSKHALALYAGLSTAVILDLKIFNFRPGLLMAIVVGAAVCWALGISSEHPARLSTEMFNAAFGLDLFSAAANPKFWRLVVVLVIIAFFGAIGKSLGLTAATNLQINGRLPAIDRASLVNGFGSILGATVGTSSLIIYVESAVGIASGGRTGLTALIVGILMLVSLVLISPIVGVVPAEATAGVLLYVGYLLLPMKQWRMARGELGRFDALIALCMGGLSFITFDLYKAMLVGFWLYSFKNLLSRTERNNYLLLGTSIALSISVLLHYIGSAQ